MMLARAVLTDSGNTFSRQRDPRVA